MLSCKEVSHLNSARFDRSLTFSERVKVWIHLKICKACRKAFDQFKFMRLAMKRYNSDNMPSDKKVLSKLDVPRKPFKIDSSNHD